jgi:hypothetical protein
LEAAAELINHLHEFFPADAPVFVFIEAQHAFHECFGIRQSARPATEITPFGRAAPSFRAFEASVAAALGAAAVIVPVSVVSVSLAVLRTPIEVASMRPLPTSTRGSLDVTPAGTPIKATRGTELLRASIPSRTHATLRGPWRTMWANFVRCQFAVLVLVELRQCFGCSCQLLRGNLTIVVRIQRSKQWG